MVETFLFAILSVVSLWGYFALVGVMDFKKDPNAMEDHLPGRPARRTIGRKNDDMSKSITYIFVGYCVFCMSLYGLLDYKDFLFDIGLGLIGFLGFCIAMFLFSPANRLAHAYVNLGQIGVIHLVCALSSFFILSTVLYGHALSMQNAISLTVMIVGAMLCFSKNSLAIKKKVGKEEGEF